MQENIDNSLALNLGEIDKDKKIEFLQALTEIFSSDSNEIERLKRVMILAKEYNVALIDSSELKCVTPNTTVIGSPKDADLVRVQRIKNVPLPNIGVIGNFSTASTFKSEIEMQYENEKDVAKKREMIQKYVVSQLIDIPPHTHYATRKERRAAQRKFKRK